WYTLVFLSYIYNKTDKITIGCRCLGLSLDVSLDYSDAASTPSLHHSSDFKNSGRKKISEKSQEKTKFCTCTFFLVGVNPGPIPSDGGLSFTPKKIASTPPKSQEKMWVAPEEP